MRSGAGVGPADRRAEAAALERLRHAQVDHVRLVGSDEDVARMEGPVQDARSRCVVERAGQMHHHRQRVADGRWPGTAVEPRPATRPECMPARTTAVCPGGRRRPRPRLMDGPVRAPAARRGRPPGASPGPDTASMVKALTATSRPSAASCARNTGPSVPAPTWWSTRKGPNPSGIVPRNVSLVRDQTPRQVRGS